MRQLLHLLQMSDTAFPVGAFSFSAGLESAVASGIVTGINSLKQYVETMLRQSATTDGIAGLTAYRATKCDSYSTILDSDIALMLSKLNEESRIMQQRMGKKLSELACKLITNDIMTTFLNDIQRGTTPGTYAVAQGICFAICDMTEQQLFVSQQYGVANMILSAALRCCKVTHYDTQQILFEIAQSISEQYDEIHLLSINDMYCFMPEADVFASLHEKGRIRMFMN